MKAHLDWSAGRVNFNVGWYRNNPFRIFGLILWEQYPYANLIFQFQFLYFLIEVSYGD